MCQGAVKTYGWVDGILRVLCAESRTDGTAWHHMTACSTIHLDVDVFTEIFLHASPCSLSNICLSSKSLRRYSGLLQAPHLHDAWRGKKRMARDADFAVDLAVARRTDWDRDEPAAEAVGRPRGRRRQAGRLEELLLAGLLDHE